MFAGGRHRAGEDHIAGPQAGGGVHIIPPLQHLVDGFAEFLGEALGLSASCLRGWLRYSVTSASILGSLRRTLIRDWVYPVRSSMVELGRPIALNAASWWWRG